MDKPIVNILAARFWPERHGGVETHLWHMAHALAELGVDVRVITENRTGAPDEEKLGASITVLRVPPLNCGRLWRLAELMRVRWWRKAIGKHAPVGKIWATDPLMATAAISAGRNDDLVFNPACCAGAMHAVYKCYPYMDTMKMRGLLRWLDRSAYHKAKCIVVASDNLKQQAADFYDRRENVHIVPLGVHVPMQVDRAGARQQLGISPDTFIAGFVGRLDPCKDLGLLLQSVPGALGDHGKMLIVGQGSDRNRLKEIATRAGVGDRVIWAGPMADPAAAYAAMDVMVLPSAYEAFGTVILEAMAAGVPVIGRARCDRPGALVLTASAELIAHRQTGRIVDAHDPNSLAMAIGQLRSDPQARQTMSATARRAAGAYSWQRMAESYLKLMGIEVVQDTRRVA